MKANVAITYTRHTGRFSRIDRSEQVSFDPEQRSFVEAASEVIDLLKDYVKNARLRRRSGIGTR
jgi:hypothetical protein